MANSAVELLVLILGGLLIGWRITSDPGVGGAGRGCCCSSCGLRMLWIGIFVGLSFRGEGATMAVQVLVWPIGFLSTAIVSAETMPGWLGAIAAWNPLSATATARGSSSAIRPGSPRARWPTTRSGWRSPGRC